MCYFKPHNIKCSLTFKNYYNVINIISNNELIKVKFAESVQKTGHYSFDKLNLYFTKALYEYINAGTTITITNWILYTTYQFWQAILQIVRLGGASAMKMGSPNSHPCYYH